MKPRPKPSDDTPSHLPPAKPSALERQGIKPEEVAGLRAWSRKHSGPENRKFSEIKRARTRSRIVKAVLASIAALGLIVSVNNKDDISQWGQNQATGISDWWKAGFNKNPRGPYPGITLEDPDAQRHLQCLAEDFSDRASLFPNIGGNEWAQANCQDVNADLAQDPLYQYDPLTNLANRKNAILRAAGLQTDAPNEPAVVEWWDMPCGMRVQTREDRLEEIAKDQIARTGTTNFEVE